MKNPVFLFIKDTDTTIFDIKINATFRCIISHFNRTLNSIFNCIDHIVCQDLRHTILVQANQTFVIPVHDNQIHIRIRFLREKSSSAPLYAIRQPVVSRNFRKETGDYKYFYSKALPAYKLHLEKRSNTSPYFPIERHSRG